MRIVAKYEIAMFMYMFEHQQSTSTSIIRVEKATHLMLTANTLPQTPQHAPNRLSHLFSTIKDRIKHNSPESEELPGYRNRYSSAEERLG